MDKPKGSIRLKFSVCLYNLNYFTISLYSATTHFRAGLLYNLFSESEHLLHPTHHLQLSKWVLLLRWLYRDTFLRSLAVSQLEKKKKSFGVHENPSLRESVESTEAEASTEAEQPVSSSDTTGADSLHCHIIMFSFSNMYPDFFLLNLLRSIPPFLFLSCFYAPSLPRLVFL